MPLLHDVEKQEMVNYDNICPDVQKNYSNASREFQDEAYFYVSILEKGRKRKEEKKKECKSFGLILFIESR